MEVVLVLDVGSTNFKAAAVASNGDIVWTWRQRQAPRPGPPYLHLDTSRVYRWIADSLKEAAAQFRVAAIIPCTHGSSAALVTADGVPEGDPDRDGLALPVMGYEAEPPDDVARDYAQVAPPFREVYAPTNPAGLTLARQLFWQETRFADAFKMVGSIMPLPQYWTWRLTGTKASDISSLAAQTHLWNPVERRFSSLAVQRGWDRLIAPIRPAWDVVGMLKEPIARRAGLSEPVPVLCGIHDSSANCLRYLGLPDRNWTLLSTGTWLITFTPGQPLDRLDPTRDTVSNTDVDGNPLACSRFMIGREFECLAGADGVALSGDGIDWEAAVKGLIDRAVFALPSFTNSGGPLPGTGDRGRVIVGGADAAEGDLGPVDRRTLASLYCALMTRESLAAVGAGGRLIIDGPFATEPLYPRLLAALMPEADVRISEARDGTVLGSALLWDRQQGRAPQPPSLSRVAPIELSGLEVYARVWREAAGSG